MSTPQTWKRTRIDRVATVNARIGWRALTATEYQPDGYVFLATPNIKSGSIDFENVNYISEYRYEESPELKLNARVMSFSQRTAARSGSRTSFASFRDLQRSMAPSRFSGRSAPNRVSCVMRSRAAQYRK